MALDTIQNNRLSDGAKLTNLPTIASAPTGTGTKYLDDTGAYTTPASGGTLHASLTDLATSGHPGSIIANTPAGNIAATNVQAAINELDTEKAALAGAAFTGDTSISTSGATSAFTLTNSGSGPSLNITNGGSGDFITVDTNKMVLDNAGNLSATNLSGTNTGDQTSIVGITGTKAQFNTAVTDGDIVYVGDNITGTASNVTGTVAIANGGTGQTTQQAAIDALTNVSAATNEYVLTKDTASGNALWKAIAGGGDMLASTYDPAAVSEQLVGLTATQTLTNKTLTTPTITLKQGLTPAPTAEGDIQWDTDNDQIKVGDGVGTKTFSDDTYVLNRTNHTGTQTLSTISDAGTIASQSAASVSITGGSITGITDLAIADGGTGASTAQAAIDALSQVSAATNEYVLTKDTATGNALWKAAAGGGLTWGDSITDTSGTGVTTTIGANATIGTIGQSITIDNTQTNAGTGLSINTGTSAIGHIGLQIDAKGASASQRAIKVDVSGSTASAALQFVTSTATTAGGNGIIDVNLANTGTGNVYGLNITTGNNSAAMFQNNHGIKINHNNTNQWESQAIGAGLSIVSGGSNQINEIQKLGSGTSRGIVFQANYSPSENDGGVIGAYTSADPGVARWYFNQMGVLYLQDNTAPTTTTNKLYSVGGALTWNGIDLTAGGGDTVNKYFYGAGEFLTLSGTTFTNAGAFRPAIEFTDAANETASISFQIPAAYTTISAIRVLFQLIPAGGGNLYLQYDFDRARVDASPVTDGDTLTATASGTGTPDDTKAVTIPAAAYNGLTEASLDVISLKITRDASNAADTYNAAWRVYGIEVTFA